MKKTGAILFVAFFFAGVCSATPTMVKPTIDCITDVSDKINGLSFAQGLLGFRFYSEGLYGGESPTLLVCFVYRYVVLEQSVLLTILFVMFLAGALGIFLLKKSRRT